MVLYLSYYTITCVSESRAMMRKKEQVAEFTGDVHVP